MRSRRSTDRGRSADRPRRQRTRHTVVLLALLAGVALVAAAGFAAEAAPPPGVAASPPADPAISPPSAPLLDREQRNLATFDRTWTLVADTHWDPDLGGLDWEGVRDELRPEAAAAADDGELRGVLQDMLSRLGQSHFAILPGSDQGGAGTSSPFASREGFLAPGCHPAARAEILAAFERRGSDQGELGLELRILDGNEVVVTRLTMGGPAARAGVATGWKLLAVDGRPLARRLACFEAGSDSSLDRRSSADRQLVDSWLEGVLSGPSGTQMRLRFDVSRRREREVGLEREPAAGEVVAFGNLPPAALRFEIAQARTRRRAPVAVVSFNLWLLPVATAFERAMPELREAAALVIDLRGNPGGVSAIAQGVAGHFVAEPLSLGTMKGRRDELELVVNPRRVARDGSRVEPFAGPLAILLDEGSASTSELFAAGLRDHQRARLFGAPSAGAALPSVMDRLPNGDVFMHASMDYIRPNGQRVEGRPIVPDVETALLRADLLAGRDAALQAALSWIDDELAHAASKLDPRQSGTAR